MFQKVNATSFRKLYFNFNLENEEVVPITGMDGYREINGWGTEALTNFCFTKNNGYVGGYFMDICSNSVSNPATGFFLTAENDILFNGTVLKENKRVKITEDDEIIVCGEDFNCLFYPIIEDKNEYYMEYDKETNMVGIIGVKNGIVEAEDRIVTKFGCAFSRDADFIRENADIVFFPVCSINRFM